jgi:protein O-GlcNAc transferase
MTGEFERGLELLDAGRLEEAGIAFRSAAAADARHAKARINLGVVLQQSGDDEAAVQCYREALAIDAGLAQGWFNLGALQIERRRYGEAAECLRQAVTLDGSRAVWHSALAWSLLQSGDAEAASAAGRRALAIDPGVREAQSVVLQAMHYTPGTSVEQIHAAHAAWGRAQARPGVAPCRNSRLPERVLRIGYIAPDFREPALATFLQPVLSRHDPASFQVFCYSDARTSDPVSWRLRARNVVWRATAPITDEQFAEGIREDEIDILVDLGGHGAGGKRMPVFARKPAPVQVAWLGYPGTTGLEAIDYCVSDNLMAREGDERAYTEQLVRLPFCQWCYQPPFHAPAVAPLPAASSGAITFGSFQDPARLTRSSLDLWLRLLSRLPGTRLVLGVPYADQFAARVAEACRAAGVASERVRLHPISPGSAALAPHDQVDIGLDAIPCAGTAATLDALWMGVPVVTMTGLGVAARSGAGLLEAVGLPELVARGEAQYLDIAAGLAADPARLGRMREGMRARLRSSPLLDAAGFTRDLETAYREIWHVWCAGKEPHPRRVVASSPARTPAAAPARSGRPGQRIVVDGVFFQNSNTGIARVWRSVLREWSASGFAERVLLLDRDGSAPDIPGVRRRAVPRHAYERPAEERALLQRVCDEEQAAAFISTYFTSPLATPSVALVNDMIPELFGTDLRRAEWREKDVCIRGAARLVTISTNTASDLCAFYPQIEARRVTVAHCGVDPLFHPATEAELAGFRGKHGIRKPYFLLVGSRVSYKNGDAFFRAFARNADRRRYAVVCVGGERDLESAQREACAGSELHMIQLDDDALRLAYGGAIALVYPSVYEGFGLPVVEAMASACPVITTSRGSLGEVAGDAAFCVEPMKVGEIAAALEAIQEPELRQTLIAAGLAQARKFSWAAMAQSLAKVLSEVAT